KLEKMALRTGDFQTGYTMKLIDGGDQVAGQVTLDNCGFTFSTEAHRVARREYGLVDSDDDPVGLSNELVAYDTTEEATKALAEWHASSINCPSTPIKSQFADSGSLVFKVSRNDVDAAGLPVPHDTITVESIVDGSTTDYE